MLFELSDMRQILKEYGVMDYDMTELARVVRAAEGKPVLLAKQFEASVAPPSDTPSEPTTEAEVIDNRAVMSFHMMNLPKENCPTFAMSRTSHPSMTFMASRNLSRGFRTDR